MYELVLKYSPVIGQGWHYPSASSDSNELAHRLFSLATHPTLNSHEIWTLHYIYSALTCTYICTIHVHAASCKSLVHSLHTRVPYVLPLVLACADQTRDALYWLSNIDYDSWVVKLAAGIDFTTNLKTDYFDHLSIKRICQTRIKFRGSQN